MNFSPIFFLSRIFHFKKIHYKFMTKFMSKFIRVFIPVFSPAPCGIEISSPWSPIAIPRQALRSLMEPYETNWTLNWVRNGCQMESENFVFETNAKLSSEWTKRIWGGCPQVGKKSKRMRPSIRAFQCSSLPYLISNHTRMHTDFVITSTGVGLG